MDERWLNVGVLWSRNDPVDQLPLLVDDPRLLAIEHWVKSYMEYGWELVKREAYPPRVWITYPAHRRGPLSRIDGNEDRVIWIDENGAVRVTRVEDLQR